MEASHHHHDGQKNIRAAFLLNFLFTLIEIAGGIWTNSLAILSDALHDLGDSLSLGVAWFLEKYAKKGPDKRFSFGYARFSLLGALISSIVLISGSLLILIRIIPRILHPEAVNPKGMMVLAVLGVLANGFAVLRLRRGSSMNEKIVSWHLLEDLLGWIVVLTVSIVLMFWNVPVLDPLLSLAITIYVVFNVVKNLIEIMKIFLQGVPVDYSAEAIETRIVEQTSAVKAYHTHIWSMDGEHHMLSTHILLKEDAARNEIIKAKQTIKEIAQAMQIDHVTVQVDFDCETDETYEC